MNHTDAITLHGERTPEEDFASFIGRHFDADYYLQAYPDVSASGLEPLHHWLQHGLAEGRQMSQYVVVRQGDVARRSASRIWRHFRANGMDVAVRLIDPMPPNVILQIVNQARHDPAVLAAGADTITQLSQQDRENVHLDVRGLRRAVPRSPDVLVIVPDLGKGPSQTLAANISRVLGDLEGRSVQLIVINHGAERTLGIPTELDPWQSANVVFWPDYWIHGPDNVNKGQLAQFISVLHPRLTMVVASPSGYEMVARYGRALSTRTDLYCIVTAGEDMIDPYSVSQALAFATLLTDDTAFANKVRFDHGDHPAGRVEVLPHHTSPDFRGAVMSLFRRW